MLRTILLSLLTVPLFGKRDAADLDRARDQQLLVPSSNGVSLRAESLQANDQRTVDVIFSAGAEFRQWWGREQLVVSEEAITMTRLQSRMAPVLFNHNPDEQIGVVETAAIQNGQALATCRFSQNPAADGIYRDILSGIRSQISCGYRINTYEVDDPNGNDPLYRVTSWEPYEISVVTIAADAGAIVERSGYLQPPPEGRRSPLPVQQTQQTPAVTTGAISQILTQLGISPEALRSLQTQQTQQGNQNTGNTTTEMVLRLLAELNLSPEQLTGQPVQDIDKEAMRTMLVAQAKAAGIRAEGNNYLEDVWNRRFVAWSAQDIIDQIAIWDREAQNRFGTAGGNRQTVDVPDNEGLALSFSDNYFV